MTRPQHSPRSRLRVPSHINDNHCVNSVTGQKNSVYVTSKTGLNPPPVVAGDKKVTLNLNVDFFVTDPPVGARLHQCWEKWEALGLSPKVVSTLREGYTLPFWFRPNLTRPPTVISNYHNPAKQANLLEALYQLLNKNAVEPVENQNSLGFYNRLFLVPKPNNR